LSVNAVSSQVAGGWQEQRQPCEVASYDRNDRKIEPQGREERRSNSQHDQQRSEAITHAE
jgi:hypothetical protein